MGLRKDAIVLGLLTAITTLLAAILCWTGTSSWLEAVAFVTGAICVWLTVKENVWNFPIGLVNVAAFTVVFFDSKLYADAGLQIVYFVLGIVGWYLWLRGGEGHTALKVVRTGKVEWIGVVISGVILTYVLQKIVQFAGGSASFWDALTTAISLCAQWLLNRKRLESWHLWIVVDVIYIPLYLYKDLMLTAVLYAVFLAMAVMGLLEWRATLRRESSNADTAEKSSDPLPVEAAS